MDLQQMTSMDTEVMAGRCGLVAVDLTTTWAVLSEMDSDTVH